VLCPKIGMIRKTHKDRVGSHHDEAISGYEFTGQDASGSIESG